MYTIYLQKSNSDKKLHNKKGYSFKIVQKTTLQKSYIHRKNYKYKKYKILNTTFNLQF